MAASPGLTDASREAAALHGALAALGTPERAAGAAAYLKSDLVHLGATVPEVRRVVRAWLRAHRAAGHDERFALADALWAEPVHELRLAAVEVLYASPQHVTAADLPWIEAHLRDCGTWALVDPLAGWVAAALAVRDPGAVLPVLDRWTTDADFWIRRSAVLALRSLLAEGREWHRLDDYATRLLPEREFFVRKVLGWVLREEAARNPERVSAWLRSHMAGMNLVTLREPLRRLPDAAELRALYDARQGTRRNASG